MKPSLIQPSLSRDFAILAGVILFVLLLLSLWIIWSTHAEQSRTIVGQLEKEVDRIDRTLEREIQNANYVLTAMSNQIRSLEGASSQQIARILQAYQSHNRIYSIWAWTDNTQSVVVSSNRGVLDEPVDVSDRDYIHKSLLEPWVLQIGAPIEGRVSERWVIPASMGVTDETGRYIGSISASLNIEAITAEIADLVRRPGISFAILNKEKTKIAEVSTTNNFVETYFAAKQLDVMDLEKQPRGIVSQADLFSMEGIYSYYKLSKRFPYILLVGYDAGYSQAAIETRLIPRLIQIVSIAALVLFFLWIIKVRVIRPVVGLTKVTADIARGIPYEFDQNKAPMEIDALALQIYRLSDYIEERKRVESELHDKLEAEFAKQQRAPEDSQKLTEE